MEINSLTYNYKPIIQCIMNIHRWIFLFLIVVNINGFSQNKLRIVELNTENLFDTKHDSLKHDFEFLPDGVRHWNPVKYWTKLNSIGKEIISCGKDSNRWVLPDIVALCEVENDSVLYDLTKKSLLRKARYEYIMTNSADERGIDVALMYSPFSFRIIKADTIRVEPLKDMRPTRDILHVKGELLSGDTLHIFVIHAPSRSGGELVTRPYRILVMKTLLGFTDTIYNTEPLANIIIIGDFNDYTDSPAIKFALSKGFIDVSSNAKGSNGAKATYKYQGEWRSLDHILVNQNLYKSVGSCYINDEKFLLEEDAKYGSVKPKRNFIGMKWNKGYSDHLPLVLDLTF